jgi:NAD(P)-dependent dehydrogenase (short-subunit alcohol dehydrogenase family)
VAYGRAKTANILFAVEFDRRYRDKGIRAAAVHPGGIQTELARHIGDDAIDNMITQINADLVKEGKPSYEWKTVPQGAASSVWAGITAPADEIGGKYCENCHVTTNVTEGALSVMSEGVRPYALDPANAKALWAKSEEMVGERFS